MPIREKKVYCGEDYLEVEIFPITKEQRKESRSKKEKISALKQKNLNDKNAKKYLIRLINTNFTNRDLVVHLTYDQDNLPQSEEEARKDITNYIRRLKYHRKKKGLPELKYIVVMEYREPEEGKAIRIHHHIIISGGMDRDKVEELWVKGRANADRLKSDNFGYEGLARYVSKDPRGSKRWIPSQNLKKPVVKVNDWRFSKRKVEGIAKCPDDREEFEKLYPGYTLNSCEVKLNEVVGATYIYIKMRRLKI